MKRALLIGLMLGLASCQYQSKDLDPTLDGFFVEDCARTPKPHHFAEAQAAAGARADAMLFKQHFDGVRLNTLGEDKLSLMLKDDDSPSPMVVYLVSDPSQANLAKDREVSIVAFLKDKGLRADQIEVRRGENPDSRHPTAPLVTQMNKLETASPQQDSQNKDGGGMSAGGSSLGATAGAAPGK